MPWVIIGLFMLLLFHESAWCGAKPHPPEYTNWTKPGATVLDFKKAMLECDTPSPDPKNHELGQAGMTLNDDILVGLCMRKYSGFTPSYKSYCENYSKTDLPACQPEAVIPKPSVERRLTGRYCTIKRSYEGCVKNAAYPEKCIERDFSVIVPECLP